MGIADLIDHCCHSLAVSQIDAVVVRCAAGAGDRVDCRQRRGAPLESGEFLLDQDGSRLLPTGCELLGDGPLERVRVGEVTLQICVGGVRRRCQIQQVERAAGMCREVRSDRRDDAAGSPGDEEHRVGSQLHRAWLW